MSRAVRRFFRTNPPLPTLTTPAYRVTFQYLVDQQICLVTHDFIMSTNSQTNASEQNLANSFNTTTAPQLKNALSSDCFLQTIKVQCLTTPSRLPFTFTLPSASQAGSVVGNHLPSEIAAIVTKYTATKGQHGRGRIYLPGLPSSFITPGSDANRLTATGLAATNGTATGFTSASNLDGTNLALAAVTTRVLKGAPTTQGQTVALYVSRALVGVIRRRRIGRGK